MDTSDEDISLYRAPLDDAVKDFRPMPGESRPMSWARYARAATILRSIARIFFGLGTRDDPLLSVEPRERPREEKANRALMVAGGNLLTHYDYHHCDAHLESSGGRLHVRLLP